MTTNKLLRLTVMLLLLAVGITTVPAQMPISQPKTRPKPGPGPKPTNANPKRTVLLTLMRNEVLNMGECMLALRSNGHHYACITTDTLKKKEFLFVDGIKKVTADRIYAAYLDPCDYNKSIFRYENNGSWTFFIEGRSYGPYYAEWTDNNGSWESNNMSWSQKDIYYVRNLSTNKWEAYLKGSPYTSRYGTYAYSWYSDKYKSDTIQSINKNYTVFSNEFGTITYNGVKYRIIPVQSFNGDWRQSTCILDDGRCYVGFRHKGNSVGQFIFDKGNLKELSQDQFFNFRTGRIESGDNGYGLFLQSGVYSYEKKKERVLYDASKRHTLKTRGIDKYVLIDNKRYGAESAIFINYDKERNEFQWIALERKQLVMYRYKL